MCGRYTLKTDPDRLLDFFGLSRFPKIAPRYNIAPSHAVLIVRQQPEARDREGVLVQWGLVPSWAKDPKIGYRTINAKAETVHTLPAYRAAFRKRRCLVVADGFYEWKKLGKGKEPYYIRLTDGRPFGFAGLWEHWEDAKGAQLESCTIITTEANGLVGQIHNRMPMILSPPDYDEWLSLEESDLDRLKDLLGPYPEEHIEAYPVSRMVNNPRNDDLRCIEPV